jgi:hypothetical protein
MLPRPFTTTLGLNQAKSFPDITTMELEKAMPVLQPLIDHGYIRLSTGEEAGKDDYGEAASKADIHGASHEFFPLVPAPAVGMFVVTATRTGVNNAPLAEPVYPCTLQYVVAGAFDGDGTIMVTGVRNDGVIDTEIIPVAVADAGTTIQGTKAFAQVLQTDWSYGAVWTVGGVTVQTGLGLGLRRRNVTVFKANEDNTATPAYTDMPVAAMTLDEVNGTVIASFAWTGARSVNVWYTYTAPDYVDTDLP